MSIPIPSANGKLKIPFKKLFFPLLFFLVIIIVFLKISELKEIGRLFAQAKWYWLILALGSQIVTLFLQTSVYQKIFHILDIKVFNFWQMIRAAVSLTFLNYTIPSLGFAGNINFVKNLRRRGVSEGTAIMSVIMEFICFYTAFALTIFLSFLYLFFKLGHIGYTQKIAAGGFVIVLFLVIGITFFFLGNKKRAHKRVQWLAEKIDVAENGIREEDRVRELLNDFYTDFDWLKKNKKTIIKPTLIQLVRFLSEGVTIFLVFLAFGKFTPVGLGVVAFALGRMFGLVSFIPGGVGAFEGAMVLIFNSLKIPLELALSVMLIYRFLSYWLYFPAGIICYKHLNRE